MEEMKNSENLLLSFAPNKRKNGGTRTEKCHTVERGEPINMGEKEGNARWFREYYIKTVECAQFTVK